MDIRINKFVAQATGLGRRQIDKLITESKVKINGNPAELGSKVSPEDNVTLDDKVIRSSSTFKTIALNKPVGYVCSRNGQGSLTIYDLLPNELHELKPIGRLDKDSSGLLLMTNDGDLAYKLSHPSFQKEKVYQISLNKTLTETDRKQVSDKGVDLTDGVSKLKLKPIGGTNTWEVRMSEGRNRQIRRTFEALGYIVTELERISFDEYSLDKLKLKEYRTITT
jgi:23S rRNA pseudouridine2605 synthase